MAKKWFKIREKGELSRFGYSPKKSPSYRHNALSKSIKSIRNSGLEVWHKLDGLSKVTEKTQQRNSKIYKADANYVKTKFYNTKYW